MGRLRRARRTPAAEAGPDPGLHIGHGKAVGGARRRRRDRLLRSELQQPCRDADRPRRPGDDQRPGRPALRLRRLGDGLPDAVDRAERALRGADADALDGDDRAVPRQYAGTGAAARGAGSQARGDDREPSVHGGRRGTVVAGPRIGRRPDPAGVLHLAQRAAAARARPVRGRAGRCGPACARSSAASRRSAFPANRVALELQFQSAPGTGGREGLQPRSSGWRSSSSRRSRSAR